MKEASENSIHSDNYNDNYKTSRSEFKAPHRSIEVAFHPSHSDKRDGPDFRLDSSWRYELDTIISEFRQILVHFLHPIFIVVQCICYKLYFYLLAMAHLCFSSDYKRSQVTYKQLNQTLSTLNISQHVSKRIIYIRHGESEWNVLFNRPWSSSTVWYAIQALLKEFIALPTSGSIFLDSPLSTTGVRKSLLLQKRIRSLSDALNEYSSASKISLLHCLQTSSADSIIVTSNLRRSIQTALIASKGRLQLDKEQLYVLSSLQEIGRNMDTLSLGTTANNNPSDGVDAISTCDRNAVRNYSNNSTSAEQKKAKLNWSWNHGNKAVFGCAQARMKQFLEWVFARQERVVIVYGHSLWLREFCRLYLTPGLDHPMKRIKLHNCEVVSFVVEHHQGRFHIEPKSFLFI
uniref:Uncharacterized protein AlNc14C246G9562 n=1 Tax=Albugo laibachii Nc14 TaxID=890382 RepID=F0WT77_9STRA|nr:conserved hypothetical protein [Albugo laibachii Nc14]|eukprot:CCA24565.1 conserved hypothetical protein [Albugo laibachii Nc14]